VSDVAAFFDRQAERFGPSGVLPHHQARADRLRQSIGDGPWRVSELGCGSGGTVVACAKRDYTVAVIELSLGAVGESAMLHLSDGAGDRGLPSDKVA
jgi:hypothetical protein